MWGGQKQGDRRKHTPRVPCLLQSLAAPRIDGEVTPRALLHDVYISVKGTNAAAPGAPTVFANPTARSLNDSLFISEIASSYTDVYSVDTVIRLYAIVPLAGVAGDETPIALRFADQRDAEGALFAIRASTPPTWTVMSIAPTPAEGNGAIKRTSADAANCDVVTYRVDGLLDVEIELPPRVYPGTTVCWLSSRQRVRHGLLAQRDGHFRGNFPEICGVHEDILHHRH